MDRFKHGALDFLESKLRQQDHDLDHLVAMNLALADRCEKQSVLLSKKAEIAAPIPDLETDHAKKACHPSSHAVNRD